MAEIAYFRLNSDNFSEHSLDEFIRHQTAREIWKSVEGRLTLVSLDEEKVWSWDPVKRRRMARIVSNGIADGGFGFGAFRNGDIVGFIFFSAGFWGSANQYAGLRLFFVSEPFRRLGVGRELFRLGCNEARAIGAKKLYISANCSRESQLAYRRLGCIDAVEIDERCVQDEPDDIQMEYPLY